MLRVNLIQNIDDFSVDNVFTVNTELEKTGYFSWMDIKTDENEHSIEMTLPYIAKIMEDYKDQFTIIPILVGSLNPEQENLFGGILAEYLKDPQNLFVISSDFCHWGHRFSYTYYDAAHGAIHKCIEALDKQGMDIIETLKHADFTNYLRKYNNTICGRHPIGVMLSAVNALQKQDVNFSFKFLKYAQSSQCVDEDDSSVSYAAGSLLVES